MGTLMDTPNIMLSLLKHHTSTGHPFQLQTQTPYLDPQPHPVPRSASVKWISNAETALHTLFTMVNWAQSTGRIRRRLIPFRKILGTTDLSDGALTALQGLRCDRHDASGNVR